MDAEPFFVSFARNLEQGEGVRAFSDAVVRVGRAGTQAGKVVLTDHRLMVLLPDATSDRPGEFEVLSYDRGSCDVISAQDHQEGMLAVAIQADGAVLGLDFNSGWRTEGEQVVAGLREREGQHRARTIGGFKLRAVS